MKYSSSFTAFNEKQFKTLISKYLDFTYIPTSIVWEDIDYDIDLFFNLKDNAYQIGAVGYGGIYPTPSSLEILKIIIEKLCKKFLITKITLPPFFDCDLTCLELPKYVKQKKLTSILILDEYRQMGQSIFKDSVRTDIRYADKNEIKVELFKDNNNDFEQFYQVYKETMQRVRASYQTPKKLILELLDTHLCELYLAKYKGSVIGGSVILKSHNNIFYWINACDSAYFKLRPNYKIIYTIIKSYMHYDFINWGYSHTESLRKFKQSWGSKEIQYYVFTRILK